MQCFQSTRALLGGFGGLVVDEILDGGFEKRLDVGERDGGMAGEFRF